jgi:hypothetical protein
MIGTFFLHLFCLSFTVFAYYAIKESFWTIPVISGGLLWFITNRSIEAIYIGAWFPFVFVLLAAVKVGGHFLGD